MKKHAILIAGAFLLAGCSAPAAPAAAPAASSAEAGASASSAAAPEVTASAAPAVQRMSTEETCAILFRFARPVMANTQEEHLAAMDALEPEMKTLPERASEELQDVAPTLSTAAVISFQDVRDDTRKLTEYIKSDPAIQEAYATAIKKMHAVCPETGIK